MAAENAPDVLYCALKPLKGPSLEDREIAWAWVVALPWLVRLFKLSKRGRMNFAQTSSWSPAIIIAVESAGTITPTLPISWVILFQLDRTARFVMGGDKVEDKGEVERLW